MKVLIYLEENLLAPKGGPYAVGYYIYQQLKLRNNDKIHFLPVSKENTHREKLQNSHYCIPFFNQYIVYMHGISDIRNF